MVLDGFEKEFVNRRKVTIESYQSYLMTLVKWTRLLKTFVKRSPQKRKPCLIRSPYQKIIKMLMNMFDILLIVPI